MLSQQKKIYFRRTVHKESWRTIAPCISRADGTKLKAKDWKLCYDTFNRMLDPASDNCTGYAKAGRKKVITKELARWIISRLKVLRRTTRCTSTMLMRDLAHKKKVKVEASIIRRVLTEHGFRWMKRIKKRKYTPPQIAQRLAMGNKFANMSENKMEDELHLSMDGVVITRPPSNILERENYVRTDDAYLWRKPSERDLAELHGYRSPPLVSQNRSQPQIG